MTLPRKSSYENNTVFGSVSRLTLLLVKKQNKILEIELKRSRAHSYDVFDKKILLLQIDML